MSKKGKKTAAPILYCPSQDECHIESAADNKSKIMELFGGPTHLLRILACLWVFGISSYAFGLEEARFGT